LIDLSYLASIRGFFSEAENYAQQAVSFAQQKQLENLAASGLLELGNSFSTHGNDEKAEYYYTQAIQFARANKGRVREARGLSNLGSLYIRTSRVDEGLKMVQQALEFFQQENYPRSVGICLTQLGRGYRRKGNYASAQLYLNQKLEIALQSKNQPAIADAFFEVGLLRLDEEKYLAALEHYGNALKIYESVNNTFRIAFTNTNRSKILVRLGRYDEANSLLTDLFNTAAELKGAYLQLVPEFHLIRAEMNLGQGQLSKAHESANETVRTAPAGSELLVEGKYTLGLVKAASGALNGAKKLCEEALTDSSKIGNSGLYSRALLAAAEAALKANNPATALTLATQAQERFARGGQWESEWRSWQIAAIASERLGDTAKAEANFRNAISVRSKLEQEWGPDAFKLYASRPDIRVYFR
jgi:tetratricopeptide (TPR) repeat protein